MPKKMDREHRKTSDSNVSIAIAYTMTAVGLEREEGGAR